MKKEKKMIGLSDLFGGSWKEYCQHLVKFLFIYLYAILAMVPFIILVVIAALAGNGGWLLALPLGAKISLIVLYILAVIAALILAIVYSIKAKVAWILLIKEKYPDPRKVFKDSKKFFWPFLGVSLLTVIMVLSWSVLLIIPGLVFAIYYGLACYAVVCEDKRPFSSMERSYDLVKGYWWAFFGRILALSVIALAAYMLLSMPLNWMAPESFGYWAYTCFYELVWIVIAPYFMIYSYKLYKNLADING